MYKYACAGAQNFSAARTRTEGCGSHERRARRYTNIIYSRHATPRTCCFTVLAVWLVCEYKLQPHISVCFYMNLRIVICILYVIYLSKSNLYAMHFYLYIYLHTHTHTHTHTDLPAQMDIDKLKEELRSRRIGYT
jgi:hypothetical protein